jgi:hypothetical protein
MNYLGGQLYRAFPSVSAPWLDVLMVLSQFLHKQPPMLRTGNPYKRERIRPVDPLVLICSDQLLFILQIYSFLFCKTSNEEVNCTEPSSLVRVPWGGINQLNGLSFLEICEQIYKIKVEILKLII